MSSSKSKAKAIVIILKILMLNALPLIYGCGPCNPPRHSKRPPHHGGRPKVSPPLPPIIINPPTVPPPVVIYPPPTVPPPVVIYPPPTKPHPPPHGGVSPPQKTCPIDALKLGLCLDVLGGLVHVGIGNPVENVCCPVIQGLLDLEAAICLCTVIRAKLLNLNIFIPLALQVLITCGKTPPPGFVCPPL